jgi:hypothetical protein
VPSLLSLIYTSEKERSVTSVTVAEIRRFCRWPEPAKTLRVGGRETRDTPPPRRPLFYPVEPAVFRQPQINNLNFAFVFSLVAKAFWP